MQFGLFDHIDRSDRPLAQQYDERLELVAAADAAGFYGYHLAEHHATPLNTVPVPGVFLGAVARATTRLRLGPMVYLLPLISPLRLIEEICILDHLSHGRLDVGVGRGVSPYELNFHHVKMEESRDIFNDAFAALTEGLTHERLTHHGPYYQYDDVPMILRPLQQPHPPFWYGSSSPDGAAWAGQQGLHFVSNGPTARAKANLDAYRAALATRGGPAQPSPAFTGGVAIGVVRQIYVAETVTEAHRIGKPAYEHNLANNGYLRRLAIERGQTNAPGPNVVRGTFEESLADGSVIAGTPETVRRAVEAQVRELGINYLIGYFMLGTMALPDALRSLRLFSDEVMQVPA